MKPAPLPLAKCETAVLSNIYNWGRQEGWNFPKNLLPDYITVGNCFTHEIEGEVKGVIFAQLHGNSVAHIGFFIVDPSMRKMGIGRDFFKKTLQMLAEREVKNIVLNSVQKLIPFYESFEFNKMGVLKYFSGNFTKNISYLPRNVVSFEDRYAQKLINYDKNVFPWNREIFLKSVLQGTMNRVVIYINEDNVLGYSIAQKCIKDNFMISVFGKDFSITKELTEYLLSSISEIGEQISFFMYTSLQNVGVFHEYFHLASDGNMDLEKMATAKEKMLAPPPEEIGVLSLEFG